MKLNSLQSLRELNELKGVPPLTPLFTTRVIFVKNKLSEIELLNHSSSLCLFAMRVIRDEIFVKNRENVLNMAMKEVKTLNTLLSKDNYYEEATITHKAVKETFKRLGLKPRHITT